MEETDELMLRVAAELGETDENKKEASAFKEAAKRKDIKHKLNTIDAALQEGKMKRASAVAKKNANVLAKSNAKAKAKARAKAKGARWRRFLGRRDAGLQGYCFS